MATLETDTTYYRFDHPTGFIFGEGTDAPSEEDGWFLAPEDVGDGPEVSYECTTLAAFQALLDSERASSSKQAASLIQTAQQLRASEGHRMVLFAEVTRLNALLGQRDTSEEP